MGNTISEDNEQDNKYRREEERGLASSSSIATDSNNPGNAIPERRRNSFGAIPLAVPNGQQPTANNSNFNNQVGMSSDYNHDYQQPKSGLSALLDHEQQKQQRQQQQQQGGTAQCTCDHSTQQPQPAVQDEADSASGPPPPKPPAVLGHSAPTIITTMKSSNRRGIPLPTGTPPLALMKCACTPPSSASRAKRLSLPSPASRHLRQNSLGRQGSSFNLLGTASEHNRVRRYVFCEVV